uniref:Uncharacterized protein n=1 Tax=Arundo donax TaxID=35708 RepID=A0A0A9AFI3_ARUDO
MPDGCSTKCRREMGCPGALWWGRMLRLENWMWQEICLIRCLPLGGMSSHGTRW